MRSYDLYKERRLLLLHLALGGSEGGGTSDVTVAGISPLSLVNAITAELISLERRGKCIQSGTPTPSTPVDIICNNGTLKMVDDELPIGYKRLIGIDFDGEFWYETGEALTGEDDVTMTLDNTSATGQNVFGSYNGTGSGRKNFSLYIYGSGSSSNSYFRYGDQLKRPTLGSGMHTITFGKSGTSGFSTDVNMDPDEFTTPSNTYIGMLPNSSSPEYTGDIIGSILVGTRLEWIPCESPSGVIGYYEKVNGNFIAPSGTGFPISLGYDTSHLTVFAIVGEQEVLTIGEQTASVVNLFAVGDYADTHEIVSGNVVRKVAIKVLNGTEAWIEDPSGNFYCYALTLNDALSVGVRTEVLSTHFAYDYSDNEHGTIYLETAKQLFLCYNGDTVDDLKSYLAAQYAAGTPVIVIYPLATEQSESVAGQNIVLVDGTNTIVSSSAVSSARMTAVYLAQT